MLSNEPKSVCAALGIDELPALCTTTEAAMALFCAAGENPSPGELRSHVNKVYNMVKTGRLKVKYKTPKEKQFLISRNEILKLID